MRWTLKWGTLVVVLASIAVNYAVNTVSASSASVAQISDRYTTLVTPASYAFAIWGLIFGAMIFYAVVQLMPGQRDKPVYDRLAFPLIGFSVLAALWSPVFETEAIGLATVIIFGALGCAALAFVRVHAAIAAGQHSRWLAVPFSLMLGWISVASIVCVATLLVSLGWSGGPLANTTWAVIMLAVATGLGLWLSLRYRDALVPAVMAWAAFAIWSARVNAHPVVAAVALAAAATSATCAIGVAWHIWMHRRDVSVRLAYHDPISR